MPEKKKLLNRNKFSDLSFLFLFSETGPKGTVMFQVLSHFLDSLACSDIHAARKLFKTNLGESVFTPRENEEYNRLVSRLSRS